jgi:Polyketide cyclase / dehydrase and lipid transport
MVMLRAEVVIDRTADEVWARIGNFVNVSWIPGAESSRLDGDVRTVQMNGSNKLKGKKFEVSQQLLHHDDAARTYSYCLATNMDFESMFGPGRKLTQFRGTIAVEPHGDSVARVTFDIDTDEFLAGSINHEYQRALNNLKALMEA